MNGSNLPLGLIAIVGVSWLCLKVLRGGFAAEQRMATNITLGSLGLGVLSIAAAVWWLGSVAFGVAIVLGIAIHEYGHVAAFRAMGHSDARYRLVPFLGGVAISNKLPRDQLSDFYITFMGPGIMLVPLVICGVGMSFTDGMLSYLLYVMFVVTGAINFFNLLPFWPLDGGRMTRGLIYAVSPWLADRMTILMSVGLVIFAAISGYYLIMIVALLGMKPARFAAALSKRQPAMTLNEAGTGLVAYAMAAAAHGMAGYPLLQQVLARLN